MSNYTITRETLLAVAKVRRGQVKQAKRECDLELIAELESPANAPFKIVARCIRRRYKTRFEPALAFLSFRNGSTVEAAFPVRRLAEWAKLSTVTAFDCTPFRAGSRLCLSLANEGSSVTLNGWDLIDTGSRCFGRNVPAKSLGPPIVLTAPEAGGEFVLCQP